MRRYDLRNSQNLATDTQNLCARIGEDEAVIVIFAPKDYDEVKKCEKSFEILGLEIYNSFRFNQVDWQIVAKKAGK